MIFESLDVGCGDSPIGEVNCDLYTEDIFNHRNLNNNALNVKAIKNFVICDCQKLPFRDNSFVIVYCRQVIEHLKQPLILLKELLRVSTFRVIIETVHYIGEKAFSFLNVKRKTWFKQHHISKFNRTWFVYASHYLNCRVAKSRILSYTSFPHNLFGFHLPYEIQITLEKGDNQIWVKDLEN